jgi:hypothetical protein
MGTLGEELEKILTNVPLTSIDSVRKLSQEDQQVLATFADRVAEAWSQGGTIDKADLSAILVYGFVIGHNWVKEHWTLW